jgi:crotonobetainyl-CoA:carnitine CoA-transferase CaiB-like acyl-CoA transferase
MLSVLERVRVIDLTEALAGPYCTMILGDLGGDVIKIERPERGDQSRMWGPPFIGSESAYFLSVNRNKRSVTIDVTSEQGMQVMRSLLESADVFVCNVRKVQSLQRLKLDPEAVRKYNPRIIYCSITGYGNTGPYAGRGGYDLVAQAESGLMAATGEPDGEPMRWPVAIVDMTTGLWSALGILAALYHRERTGMGQVIDQALLDSQLGWAQVMAGDTLVTGNRPPRLGNRHATIVPYQVFKAKDKYLLIAVGTSAHWGRFCEALGFGSELRDDPRFATNPARLAHYHELMAVLEPTLITKDASYLLEILRAAEIPSGQINALDEALNDPQVIHRGMIVELEHPVGMLKMLGSPLHLCDNPVTYRRCPPLLGQHTDEVLAEISARRTCAISGMYPIVEQVAEAMNDVSIRRGY